MKIRMKKENCIHCNGRGWVTPFPYHRRKKCNHIGDKGTLEGLMEEFKIERKKIDELLGKYRLALNTAEEIE